MRFSACSDSVYKQFQKSNIRIPMLLSSPGTGKTACAKDIARRILAFRGVPADQIESRIELIYMSSIEETDITGLPDLSGDYVHYRPMEAFYKMREGTGPGVIIFDEASDGSREVMNAVCPVMLERRAGNLKLSKDLYMIATGNRVEDKSGANRMSSKLANRMSLINFTPSAEDFVNWANQYKKADGSLVFDEIQIAFHRFRPVLVTCEPGTPGAFDPSRFANPTPRAWERVAHIPTDLPDDVYLEHVAGEVSEGPAVELVGFRKIVNEMPDIESIFANPAKAPVPEKPQVLWALSGSLARHCKAPQMDNLEIYLRRLPPEFAMITMRDISVVNVALCSTKAFGRWALANQQILV